MSQNVFRAPYNVLAGRRAVDMTSGDFSEGLSIELLINLDKSRTQTRYQTWAQQGGRFIWNGGNGSAPGWYFGGSRNDQLYRSSSVPDIKFVFKTNINEGDSVGWSPSADSDDKKNYAGWHYVTATAHTTGINLYINGDLVDSETGTSFDMSRISSWAEDIILAGGPATSQTHHESSNRLCTDVDIALFRYWNRTLNQSEVTAQWNLWDASGLKTIDSSVSGTPYMDLMMDSEVGDVDGNPGLGWIYDRGNAENHLEINVQTEREHFWPNDGILQTSGNLTQIYPNNGATDVAGHVLLQVEGVTGVGEAPVYDFQVDTVDTFDSVNIQSGESLTLMGEKDFHLDPNITYYWRTRVKEGPNGDWSSWSNTWDFTTRSVTGWFVRPLVDSGNAYGNGDGTSYDNAWRGLTPQSRPNNLERDGSIFMSNYKFNVSPGDTVWLCDFHRGWDTLDLSHTVATVQQYLNNVRGTKNNNVRFDCYHPTYPGMFGGRKLTGEFTDEGSGIYSIELNNPARVVAADLDGNGLHKTMILRDETQTLIEPGFYHDGNTMYIRLPNDTNPSGIVSAARSAGGYIPSFELAPRCKHLSMKMFFNGGAGLGASLGHSKFDAVEPPTHIKVIDGVFQNGWKFDAITPVNHCNYWEVSGNLIQYYRDGIYSFNTPRAGRSAYHWHIHHNTFQQIGAINPQFYENDSHCIGWQAGSNITIEYNTFQYGGGSCIAFWASNDINRPQSGIKINYNTIAHIRNKTQTLGTAIDHSNGTTSTGFRDHQEIVGNLIYDIDGNGIHYSHNGRVKIYNNTIVDVGQNGDTDVDTFNAIHARNLPGSVGFRGEIKNNLIIRPSGHFLWIQGSSDPADHDVEIDGNIYSDDRWEDIDSEGGITYLGGVAPGDRFRMYPIGQGNHMNFTEYITHPSSVALGFDQTYGTGVKNLDPQIGQDATVSDPTDLEAFIPMSFDIIEKSVDVEPYTTGIDGTDIIGYKWDEPFSIGSIMPGVVQSDNIISYWTLNECSGSSPITRIDYKSGNNLIDHGSVDFNDIDAVDICCARFGGSTDYLETSGQIGLVPTGNFTVAGWMNLEKTNMDRVLCGIWSDSTNKCYRIMYKKTLPDVFRFNVSLDGSAVYNVDVEPSNDIETGEWYHVVGRYEITESGSRIKLSVNNEHSNWVDLSETLYQPNSVEFEVGSSMGGTNRLMYGLIDEVGVWNKSLSDDDVSDLFDLL